MDRLRQALEDHKVLWIRGARRMTWQAQLRFTAALGDPMTDPDGKPILQDFHGDTFRYWHSDISTLRDLPPRFTVLHCVVAPEAAGDTLFLNSSEVLRRLPAVVAEKVRRATLLRVPPIGVFPHPNRGEDCLFFNLQCVKLDMVDPSKPAPPTDWGALTTEQADQLRLGIELHDLLDELAAQDEPGVALRITWSDGDTVIWDNYGTAHSATRMEEGLRWMRRSLVRSGWALRDLGLPEVSLKDLVDPAVARRLDQGRSW